MDKGWMQVWHPKGIKASLILPDDPTEAFAAADKALAAGWLPYAPGLEPGEERERVAFVVRGLHEREGKETPFVLLYSESDALKHSFLKVYLNGQDDVLDFEFASGIKFDGLPLYVGQDKPERGKSKTTDRFIVQTPRVFGVVLQHNPKYDESHAAGARAKGEIYKVPKRVFIRWEDERPAGAAEEQKGMDTLVDRHQLEEFDTLYNQYESKATMANLKERYTYNGLLKWLKVETPQRMNQTDFARVCKFLHTKISELGGA